MIRMTFGYGVSGVGDSSQHIGTSYLMFGIQRDGASDDGADNLLTCADAGVHGAPKARRWCRSHMVSTLFRGPSSGGLGMRCELSACWARSEGLRTESAVANESSQSP